MKPGDKVVCILQPKWNDQYGNIPDTYPIKGKIYEIVQILEINKDLYLILKEFPSEFCFKAKAFRKVEPNNAIQKELALEAVKESQKKEEFEKQEELVGT